MSTPSVKAGMYFHARVISLEGVSISRRHEDFLVSTGNCVRILKFVNGSKTLTFSQDSRLLIYLFIYPFYFKQF